MTHRIVWASVAILLALLSGACSSSDDDVASSATTAEPSTTTESRTTTTATRAPVVGSGEEWIAFNGVSPGITLIRADGTGRHVILGTRDQQRDPDWSPDGSEIAYIQGGSPRITDVRGEDPRWLIQSIPADLKGLRWASPAWSPDGAEIAIVGYAGGLAEPLRSVLATVEVATGELTPVWQPPSGRGLRSPRWSPDGQAIVFVADRYSCDNGCDLYGGSAVAVIRRRGDAWSASRAITDLGRYGPADWHPTKDLVLFGDRDIRWLAGADDEPTRLYTIRSDGSKRTTLRSFGDAERRPSGPTWTPDGRIMVTLRTADDEVRGIAVLSADGSGLKVVVPPDELARRDGGPRMRPR